ncbi:Os02g0807100 [Oryza sativa Japonica Group]|uniref:Os02g0807100 protein n=1 Tax=Oryza sativa subsp. japonica TaxID=39947 RepID=A0A0P0VR63_ORYSJ|nr:hypothetical protein EE612_014352 [Oryza sativa]BAS81484.1 Os02g0807100 [Oryza sativa Japonica Group]
MAEDGFRRRELLLVGDVSRWFLCLIQREYVRLVDVESAGHGVLAAPRLAGALARQVTLRLRPPARGCAASDVVIVGVNQVAKDGAPEHDKAVPRCGEPVGDAAAVVRRAVVPTDCFEAVVVAVASRVDEDPDLAVGDGKAHQLFLTIIQVVEVRSVAVALELEVFVPGAAGANAEGVGDADVPALVGAARPWLSRCRCHRRQADEHDG